MRIIPPTPWAMRQIFGFLTQPGHTVSLIGGGGKTTLMYFLAQTCAKEGQKVLVSTTTHIYQPDPSCYARDAKDVRRLWAEGKFAVVGTPVPEAGKLSAPADAFLDALMKEADTVFLEADGAKGLPCKAPREKEPVLHPRSDLVIGVFGLSAIGRPLAEVCFCPELAADLLGVEKNHRLTEEDAAELLSSPLGGRKDVGDRQYCVILNQCDDGPRLRTGKEIAARLAALGVSGVVMTAFDPEELKKYRKLSKGDCP